MEWYLNVLKNYANFNGRARRKEYWMFVLFNIIISVILSVVQLAIPFVVVITILYSLFILIPSIAVIVRRLHDTGRSGAWFLISFVPLVGSIILLVFMCEDSHGDNGYGANPKTTAAAY